MNLLYRAHTCACSTGKALSGSWIARWMDKVLSAGATKRAEKLLAARSDAKDAYRRAVVRQDTRAIHETGERLKAATTALLSAESRMAGGRG